MKYLERNRILFFFGIVLIPYVALGFFALNKEMLQDIFPFSKLAGKKVNTLIFPNLSAGNIAYKLMQEVTEGDAIGPVLVGLNKSAHVLQLGSSVREIINMVKVAVVDAQNK